MLLGLGHGAKWRSWFGKGIITAGNCIFAFTGNCGPCGPGAKGSEGNTDGAWNRQAARTRKTPGVKVSGAGTGRLRATSGKTSMTKCKNLVSYSMSRHLHNKVDLNYNPYGWMQAEIAMGATSK